HLRLTLRDQLLELLGHAAADRHRLAHRLARLLPRDDERHVTEPHLLARLQRRDVLADRATIDPRAVRRAEIANERLAVLDEDLGMAARERRVHMSELTRGRIASREQPTRHAFERCVPTTQLQMNGHLHQAITARLPSAR